MALYRPRSPKYIRRATVQLLLWSMRRLTRRLRPVTQCKGAWYKGRRVAVEFARRAALASVMAKDNTGQTKNGRQRYNPSDNDDGRNNSSSNNNSNNSNFRKQSFESTVHFVRLTLPYIRLAVRENFGFVLTVVLRKVAQNVRVPILKLEFGTVSFSAQNYLFVQTFLCSFEN